MTTDEFQQALEDRSVYLKPALVSITSTSFVRFPLSLAVQYDGKKIYEISVNMMLRVSGPCVARLLLDGQPVGGDYECVVGQQDFSIVYQTVLKGAHLIEALWRVKSGTAQCGLLRLRCKPTRNAE